MYKTAVYTIADDVITHQTPQI